MSELFPGELAAADQELAALGGVLSELVDRWRALGVGFELMGFDYLDRIAAFMVGDVRPRLDVNGLLAVVAIAVDRIVKLEDRLAGATYPDNQCSSPYGAIGGQE